MRGAIPPLSQYAFMAWCSVKTKHRVNFTFTFFSSLQIVEERVSHLYAADKDGSHGQKRKMFLGSYL
jgi:hypothetical protein